MKYACPGACPGDQVLCGQDEAVNQVVHVGVIQTGGLAADQHLDVAGQHAFEYLAEHRLIAAAPDSTRPNRTGQKPLNSVLGQHESLGYYFGLGVEVVETVGVGQRLVSAGDALAAHHHAVGRGVDEPFHPGGLRGVHQVLGSLDVDGETALPVLLGYRCATHQLDERRGVEDGVDPRDGARDDVGVAMSPCSTSKPGWAGSGEGARSKDRTW